MDKFGLNRLLIQVSKGSEEAFERLYMETSKGIYALIYPYFHNAFDTEDALQEVYMRIKDKAHLYKKGTDARSWMFQLAKNCALNILRSQTKKQEYEDIVEENIVRDKETDKSLFLFMEKCLEEDEYEIVVRYVLMGYKHKEISQELNMPLGTVLYKYSHALEKLRKEWER